eukprot:205976_1
MVDREEAVFSHHALLTLAPSQRETAVITHQKLTDILKAKQVRPIGLDVIREYHVFETFNEVISQINTNDMQERSILLKRVREQLNSTVKTWKILSNHATIYGLNKSNQNKSEIQKFKSEIQNLKQRKQDLLKQRNQINKKYDQMLESEKNELNSVQNECQQKMQKYQQQQAA